MDSSLEHIHELGLLDDQTPQSDSFWPYTSSKIPFPLEYEGPVSIRTSKIIFNSLSSQWLGFKSPILYFAEKPTSKEFKCLNLKATPCNLIYYTKLKSKMPHRVVLRHHGKAMTFYFKEEPAQEAWVKTLRSLCLMDDFSSQYSRGKSTIVEDFHSSFLARGKQSGERFVAKVYDLKAGSGQGEILDEEIKKQMIWNEVQAMRTISHPNIIKLQDLYESSGEILAITQYIGGSTLVKHIQSKGYLPEAETIYLMRMTLQTLQDLHKQKVIHRNLHPENILINYTSNGTQLKIVNFSASCTLDSDDQSSWHLNRNLLSMPGTPGYMAPELFCNKQSTIESEIFSLGAIIYACLTGEPLFKGRDQQEISNKNKEMIIDERAERWHSLSDNAKHLIEKMTDKDPKRRPSINSILAHPFFSTSLSYKTSLECENYIPRIPKLSIDTKYASESTESPYTNKNINDSSVNTASPMTLGINKQSTQDYTRVLSAQGSLEYISVKPKQVAYSQKSSFEPLILEATETEFKSEFETDSPPVDDGAQIVRRNIKNLTSPPFSHSPFSGHSALLDSVRARKAESFPEEELFNNVPSIHKFSDLKKFGY